MIIITGASRGIGKYLLEYYIKKGVDVVGFYNTTLPKINQEYYYKLDVGKELDVESFVSKYFNRLKNIVLINSAGISISGFAHKLSEESWNKTFNVNTTGVFLIVKQILQLMREQKFGRIINISSIVPQIGAVGNVAYSASKSALWGLSKVIAIENANKGITSNCINLGYFDIGMINTIPKDILSDLINTIPMKKLGDPINIINAVEFLIKTDYITGSEININGGRF